MNLRPHLLAIGAAVVLGVSACGDDEEPSGYAAFTSSEETPRSETTAAEPSEAPPAGEKPEVTIPEGAPPSRLEIEDLKEGGGATARAGDTVTVHYVGVAYSTGKQFDASWDAPGQQPFTFSLGAGEVIPGWDQGIDGMKVGGRRRLTIPPELGYGEPGQPPDIGPNETLVFVVDLLGVE